MDHGTTFEHRGSAPKLAAAIWLTLVAVMFSQISFGLGKDEIKPGDFRVEPPRKEKPRRGAVRLKNGIIFEGMCSKEHSLAPASRENDLADRALLEMRMVNQGAREIYLPVRRCDKPVDDNTVWPVESFPVQQHRTARKDLSTGSVSFGFFDANGIADGKLYRSNGTTEDMKAGIVSVNELFAEVNCLTHDLTYKISLDAIPSKSLIGMLLKVEPDPSQPFRKLDLVRMLIKADRLIEAANLLDIVRPDFPNDAQKLASEQEQINELLARQITAVLERRRDVGQHQLSSMGARQQPSDNLTPEAAVRIRQLVLFYDDLSERMDRVESAISNLVADVNDADLRESATRISRLVSSGIDEDSINRFAAFELIAPSAEASGSAVIPVSETDGVASKEELLAMAYSGWLMGADNTVKSLSDTVSLFDVRQDVIDYLNTEASETELRRSLAEQISRREGAGIERVAAIVRNLPSIQALHYEFAEPGSVGAFEVDSTAEMFGAVGIVPPEYHESRRYPMVIAFPSQLRDAQQYLEWWKQQSAKSGTIIVVPLLDQPNPENAIPSVLSYDASAETHTKFLSLVRRLKFGLRIDDDRLFVAGHGVGGEAAMDMATSHPDIFAGIVSICGAGRGHINWTASNAIQMPWYIVVGDAQGGWYDRMGILASKFFRRDEEMKTDYDAIFVKYPSRGFESYFEEADDIFDWMAIHKRNVWSEKVYAKLTRSTDLHWSWLKLASLPPQFVQLDDPTVSTDDKFRSPPELVVRRDDKNLVRIVKSAQTQITLMLSPEMPGLDVNKPIRIANGPKSYSVDYDGDVGHLLEELYETGDRSRLCFMKIEVKK